MIAPSSVSHSELFILPVHRDLSFIDRSLLALVVSSIVMSAITGEYSRHYNECIRTWTMYRSGISGHLAELCEENVSEAYDLVSAAMSDTLVHFKHMVGVYEPFVHLVTYNAQDTSITLRLTYHE